MKPEISILMPAIRPQNWIEVYNSALKSTNRFFELVIVSPYSLPKELERFSNVKLIRDFGSPTRASCIGSLVCEGKFVFPTMADDAVFIDGALDKNIDFLISMGDSIKNIVVCKYSESENFSAKDRFQDDNYYKIVNAYPVSNSQIPKDWLIFNTALWYREYFDYIGGFDSSFEACPFAHCDLSIRTQRDGANVSLTPYPIIHCNHGQNDHKPIEIAQILFDTPKFAAKYSQPLDNFPIQIDKMNWKNSEQIWSKRFK